MEQAQTFRVSPEQERLWQDEPDGPTGRAQATIEIAGPLDPARLRDALRKVVERHEILRTTFVRRASVRVPLQLIHDSLEPGWEALDLAAAETAASQGSALKAAVETELNRALDFDHGPLVHALLIERGADNALLVLTVSSLCADAGSLEVLVTELATTYGGEPPTDEVLQYADFSEWQHELSSSDDDGAKSAKEFWGRADDQRSAVPLVWESDLPHEPGAVQIPIDAVLSADVVSSAARYGSSPAVLALSAWHALLARASGSEDVVVEAVGAVTRHPSLAGAIGAIEQPLPIPVHVAPGITFPELVDRVERELAEAAVHQDYAPPRAESRSAVFVVRPYLDVTADGARFSVLDAGLSDSGALLSLVYEPTGGDGFGLSIRFDQAAVAADWAESLAQQLERLLRGAIASPSIPLSELDLLGDDDRRRLTIEFNKTDAPIAEARVHELFARHAAQAPERIAVSDGAASLTYAELDERANQLAHRLLRAGVEPGHVVALCTDRSVEMVVGLLGILKTGAAYLPLNFEHPAARLECQLVEAAASAIVTQEALVEHLPTVDVELVCLDRDRTQLDEEDTAPIEAPGVQDNLAYVIYTSGSTGSPKGVAVTHRNLANYVGDMIGRLGADAEPLTFGMVTAVSTDLGNTAIFPALCSGGTLELIKPEIAGDPAALARQLEGQPVDILKITPSHLTALLVSNDAGVLPRRWLVLGGERSGWDLVARVRERAQCTILNHYGPTETTVGSCAGIVPDSPSPYGPATVPIGRPISNTRCYVLDDRLEPVPIGAPGRMFIGGAGVARGYIGQPELTAERFSDDPFAGTGARMYDTGDRVRWLPDGSLEFLGRFDEQVKIRGFRVEPGEVEAALRMHPAVSDDAVVAFADAAGDARLVAYCATREVVTVDELRHHLAEWVPGYMIPSTFIMLEALPLTASGKVDRMTLADPATAHAASDDDGYVAPRTAVEQTVAEIWANVLGLERVGVEDDFFALGGHSLLATQVVAQVRSDLAVDLPLHSLFTAPTVAALSAEIVALMGAADGDETAKLVAQLEGLSDEEAERLLAEFSQGEDASR